MLLVVAAYLAWAEEHKKYEAELAKNLRLEIEGQAFAVELLDRPGEDGVEAHGKINFALSLCNHRSVATNIKYVLLDGSALDRPVRSEEQLKFSWR